jgi:hypothetical protein
MSAFDNMRARCAEIKEREPALTVQADRLLESVTNLELLYAPEAATKPSDPFIQYMETAVIPMLEQLITNLHSSIVVADVISLSTNIVTRP